MPKIFLTGANGFLGQELCRNLNRNGYQIKGTFRTSFPLDEEFKHIDWIKVADLNSLENDKLESLLDECDIVIHAAARVHQMASNVGDDELYFRDNVLSTKKLIQCVLKKKNIKQFIFISTVLVHGKNSKMPLNLNTNCLPDTPYGRSKFQAEEFIQSALVGTSISWTIFRPVVMYGKSNKGNILSLEKYINKHIPLPIKSLDNKRSFLYVNNFCEIIRASLLNSGVYNKVLHISDPKPVSTENLVQYIEKKLGKSAIKIKVPYFVLLVLAKTCDFLRVFGIKLPWGEKILNKIYDDFWIDMTNTTLLFPDLNLLDTEKAFEVSIGS